MSFEIHPQLHADCHLIGRFENCWLLLHHDAALPWFILVPETSVTELLLLEADTIAAVMGESQRVNRFVHKELNYKKFNFASIGNVVPQLHMHVIGRSSDDPCWPAPVWGNLKSEARYSTEQLTDIKHTLHTCYGMQFVDT